MADFDWKLFFDFFVIQANKSKKHRNSKSISLSKIDCLIYYAYAWWVGLQNEKPFWTEAQAVKSEENQQPFIHNANLTREEEIKALLPLALQKHLEAIWKAYGKYSAHSLLLRITSEAQMMECLAFSPSEE